jgi:hypothetical protein
MITYVTPPVLTGLDSLVQPSPSESVQPAHFACMDELRSELKAICLELVRRPVPHSFRVLNPIAGSEGLLEVAIQQEAEAPNWITGLSISLIYAHMKIHKPTDTAETDLAIFGALMDSFESDAREKLTKFVPNNMRGASKKQIAAEVERQLGIAKESAGFEWARWAQSEVILRNFTDVYDRRCYHPEQYEKIIRIKLTELNRVQPESGPGPFADIQITLPNKAVVELSDELKSSHAAQYGDKPGDERTLHLGELTFIEEFCLPLVKYAHEVLGRLAHRPADIEDIFDV